MSPCPGGDTSSYPLWPWGSSSFTASHKPEPGQMSAMLSSLGPACLPWGWLLFELLGWLLVL